MPSPGPSEPDGVLAVSDWEFKYQVNIDSLEIRSGRVGSSLRTYNSKLRTYKLSLPARPLPIFLSFFTFEPLADRHQLMPPCSSWQTFTLMRATSYNIGKLPGGVIRRFLSPSGIASVGKRYQQHNHSLHGRPTKLWFIYQNQPYFLQDEAWPSGIRYLIS